VRGRAGVGQHRRWGRARDANAWVWRAVQTEGFGWPTGMDRRALGVQGRYRCDSGEKVFRVIETDKGELFQGGKKIEGAMGDR